jgi:RNA polymerase sigma factor (sigma-70 family)
MRSDRGPHDVSSSDAVAAHLAEHRARYLAFVRSRVESAEVAEDLLQDAVTRALTTADSVRGPVEPWFFRALRNGIIDHMRRRGASARAIQALAHELQPHSQEPTRPLLPCPCVLRLQQQLKPEYAEALEQVSVAGMPVKDFADRSGISATHAGVRLFRAREALRKDVVRTCGACAANGCADCSCAAP